MENNKIVSRKNKLQLSCLLLGLLFYPIILSAQNSSTFKKDSLRAEVYFADGIQWNEKGQPDSALVSFNDAAELFERIESWPSWSKCQYAICINLYKQQSYDELIDYLQFASDHILPQANDPVMSSKINAWFGYAYRAKGMYDKALEYYLMEAKILEDAGNPQGRYGDYSNIAVFYSMQGDYDNALIYLDKAEAVHLADHNTKKLIRAYWNKGRNYWAKGNAQLALDFYQKYYKTGGYEYKMFAGFAEVYRDMGELEVAMDYTNKAIKGNAVSEKNYSKLLALMGSIYILQKKHFKAIEYFQQAISSRDDTDPYSDRELGQLYIGFGDAYFATGQYPLAMTQYQLALNTFIPAFQESNVNINPTLETMDLAYGVWIMEALVGKGNVFKKQYTVDDDPEQLQHALACYKSAFKSINILRYHQTEEASKIGLIDYAHPIYEQAIGAAMDLYEISKEDKYLDQAFAFSQRTKAFLLATALQNINAREVGGIPDSLIQKERDLKAVELALNQEILSLENQNITSADSLKLQSLENKRFETKRSLQKLLASLEQNYPEYYQLKYEDKVASITDIRKHVLDRNTALIDYFLGDSSLFVLTITKDKVDFLELDRDEKLANAIATFIFQAKNTDFISGANSAFEQFTESSFYLFQQLLEKPLASAGQNINQLLIIPDGRLNKISFEALLTSPPENLQANYSFSNLSYLLEEYAVSYHYAPQVLLAQKKQARNQLAPKLFAGFAPDFSNNKMIAQVRDCSELGLSKLAYNQQEVEKISREIGGKSFLNTEASVEVFKAIAKDYRILHLATHACMSEEDPLNHKIFFTNEEYLSASELFNLPLNAEMVVLSACETGIGQIVKGEGVMSLARGFSYTGCPSVMMSLWSVPDKASADIMVGFYENLDEGFSKDQALRNAKLSFIKDQKSTHQHPYYWAAFVPIGDSEALSMNAALPIWAWFTGLAGLFVIGFIYFRKYRARS